MSELHVCAIEKRPSQCPLDARVPLAAVTQPFTKGLL